jgi:hypothetical protein
MSDKSFSARKRRLCALLRSAANCFIDQTTGTTPAEIRESSQLRNETESLVSLYESGEINPVESLQNIPFLHEESASDPAPLTGANS